MEYLLSPNVVDTRQFVPYIKKYKMIMCSQVPHSSRNYACMKFDIPTSLLSEFTLREYLDNLF